MFASLLLLGLLVAPWCALRPVPGWRERSSLRGSLGLTLVFLVAGIAHFATTDAMAEMIPPMFLWRRELILASGAFEILLGLAFIPERSRAAAGWISIALLAALLPFNIYAAWARVPYGGHELGLSYLLIRIPVQGALAAWSWWFAVRPGGAAKPGTA